MTWPRSPRFKVRLRWLFVCTHARHRSASSPPPAIPGIIAGVASRSAVEQPAARKARGRPATGQTTAHPVRLPSPMWAGLERIGGKRGRAGVIRDAISLYMALWAELGGIAREHGLSPDVVVRDAVAVYLAASRDPVGGEIDDIAREQGRPRDAVVRDAVADYVL